MHNPGFVAMYTGHAGTALVWHRGSLGKLTVWWGISEEQGENVPPSNFFNEWPFSFWKVSRTNKRLPSHPAVPGSTLMVSLTPSFRFVNCSADSRLALISTPLPPFAVSVFPKPTLFYAKRQVNSSSYVRPSSTYLYLFHDQTVGIHISPLLLLWRAATWTYFWFLGIQHCLAALDK